MNFVIVKVSINLQENECYQEELRKAQRQLLQVSRDKSYLLDRLIQYENVQSTTSDSDATLSSGSDNETRKPENTSNKRLVFIILNLENYQDKIFTQKFLTINILIK